MNMLFKNIFQLIIKKDFSFFFFFCLFSFSAGKDKGELFTFYKQKGNSFHLVVQEMRFRKVHIKMLEQESLTLIIEKSISSYNHLGESFRFFGPDSSMEGQVGDWEERL